MVDYTLSTNTGSFLLSGNSVLLQRKYGYFQWNPAFIANFRTLSLTRLNVEAYFAIVGISDSLTYTPRYLFTDGFSVNHVSTPLTIFNLSSSDQILNIDEVNWINALIGLLSETIGIDENLDPKLNILISEFIRISELIEAGGVYNVEVDILMYINDIFKVGIGGTLVDTINVADIFNIILGTYIADQIGLALDQGAPTNYNLILLHTISLNSSLQYFLGGNLFELFSFSDTQSAKFITYPLLSDSLSLSEVLGHSLVFRVTFAETINFDHEDIIQQLIIGSLDDGIEIFAGYISPSGSFTTWTVNTRSGVTTEYQNYNFNSFAKIGNKYIGASSTGIYELLGDTDNSSTIVSTIASGLMQVAGSKFTSFKAAYLGIRGEGDYLLKLVSGEGQEYIYKAHVDTMKSARVNFGKGLRSRYFSYQLQNIDTDFDLDTIEFIPIGANRRV